MFSAKSQRSTSDIQPAQQNNGCKRQQAERKGAPPRSNHLLVGQKLLCDRISVECAAAIMACSRQKEPAG